MGMQCAGNRRTAMSKTKTVKGVGWDVSAVGNGLLTNYSSNFLVICNLLLISDRLSAVWGGAKLVDVLELVGIAKFSSSTKSGGKHVEFVSVDKCKVQP